jgi:4-hydroxy-tetrahydrodipicolinate reductase
VVRVGVAGALGRLGRVACEAVEAADDLKLSAAFARRGGERIAGAVTDDELGAFVARGLDVVVDCTVYPVTLDVTRAALEAGIPAVVGATGWTGEDVVVLSDLCDETGVPAMLVPNFSFGAVLMMRFAAQAARLFESAEIIELHHANKMDAPSGTALRTAAMIGEARAKAGLGASPDATKQELAGARGAVVDDVHVHSVRVSGLVAHQEVILGGHGETLTIRHDSLDRASFMPGVLLAVRNVAALPAGLTVGIEPLLGLG